MVNLKVNFWFEPKCHAQKGLINIQIFSLFLTALYLLCWLIDSLTMLNSYQTIPTLVVFAFPSTMPHTMMSVQCRTQSSDIIISAKFQNFDRISQFRQNFTIWKEFHNFSRISQFRQNFTILAKFHNFGRISQFRQF